MKKPIFTAALLALVTVSGTSLSAQSTEGRDLAVLGFQTADDNSDGQLSVAEMLNFRSDAFFSIDHDESGDISLDEFMDWGWGFSNIADETKKMQAFETAQKVIFDIWDRDGDQKVSDQEHERAILSNTSYADLNGDGSLAMEEYLQGFIINIAYRAALRPE